MSQSPFAKPTLDIAREHLTILLGRFGELTGYPPTLVARLARGEPKFARSYLENHFGFRSYDTVVSRLSALWPTGAAWPAEVPRQAPAVIEADVLAELAARDEKARPKALPDGAPWPDDIPRPEHPANHQQDTASNG